MFDIGVDSFLFLLRHVPVLPADVDWTEALHLAKQLLVFTAIIPLYRYLLLLTGLRPLLLLAYFYVFYNTREPLIGDVVGASKTAITLLACAIFAAPRKLFG